MTSKQPNEQMSDHGRYLLKHINLTIRRGIEEINIKEHIIAIGQLSSVCSQHDLSYIVSSHAHDHHCRKITERQMQVQLITKAFTNLFIIDILGY